MKSIIIILLSNLYVIISFSQENTTYKGSYKGRSTTGEVEYKYYENKDFERIYNGYFTYQGMENYYYSDISINGMFRENKKHGQWTFRLYSDKPATYEYENYELKVSGNYLNGNLDGRWTYTREINGIYEDHDDFSTCEFKDNKFHGEYISEYGVVKVIGTFDKNGFLDGKWNITWAYETSFEEVRMYKNGYCYTLIYRNLSTGEILNRFDKSEIIDSLSLLDVVKDTIIRNNKIVYKIEIMNIDNINEMIYSDDTYNIRTFSGLRYIYNSLGFWVCDGIYPCRSSRMGGTLDMNYMYEIIHGIHPVNFMFEKKIHKIIYY